jgi:uncharacterized protein (DUF433 family)
MDIIRTYLSKERGRLVRLASELGISPGAISQWERVPTDRVLDVERATGIPSYQLRPDIYRAQDISEAGFREEMSPPFFEHEESKPLKSVLDDFPHITRIPGVMGGKPCIKGSRMTVGMIVAQIGGGATVEELLDDFPLLSREEIFEAIRYAAWMSSSMVLDLESAA